MNLPIFSLISDALFEFGGQISFFDFDFDDTRFRSFQSQDHVQVLKTETDWPRWYGDGANQIIIVTKTGIGLGGAKQIVNVTI